MGELGQGSLMEGLGALGQQESEDRGSAGAVGAVRQQGGQGRGVLRQQERKGSRSPRAASRDILLHTRFL